MVTNTELFKLITEFKDESKVTCENITKANEESIQVLTSAINGRLDLLDQRLNKIDDHHAAYDVKFEAMDERIDEVDTKANEALTSALNRIAILENKLLHLENVEIPNRLQQLKQENESLKDKVENIEDIELPNQIRQLKSENEVLREELESRTNRQLRRTLIFRNIPETKPDESYAEVKTLLAEIISTHTNITKEEAFAGIERSHREAKRQGVREGKRKIFAAFLNWDLPQLIINEFRKKCIGDKSFHIYVDQMYGPLTTQRRNLAFETRKNLKERGVVSSAYVAFPAKLMVSLPGRLDINGKKTYTCHRDFSKDKIEKIENR